MLLGEQVIPDLLVCKLVVHVVSAPDTRPGPASCQHVAHSKYTNSHTTCRGAGPGGRSSWCPPLPGRAGTPRPPRLNKYDDKQSPHETSHGPVQLQNIQQFYAVV